MIVITYNESEEMMEITKDDEVVFIGNDWDFDSSPEGLKEFLISLGLEVKTKKTKKSIC